MDVFIYFPDRLPYGRDELEDALNEALDGLGEVSGGGSGETGSNIDIEIFDEELTKSQIAALVRDALSTYNLPPSCYMTIENDRLRIHG